MFSLIPFDSVDDVVARANNIAYLSAAIWTSDLKRAHTLASQIEAGTVWVNCTTAFDPAVSFAGCKASVYGRDLGKHAIDLYTQIKSVCINLAE